MLGTYAATTADVIHKHVPRLLQKKSLTIHWVGASIGEADSLPTVEAFLLHQLPECMVRFVCLDHQNITANVCLSYSSARCVSSPQPLKHEHTLISTSLMFKS
jgi:hypothetical protein